LGITGALKKKANKKRPLPKERPFYCPIDMFPVERD
jgi:hypothetical protein